MDAKFNTKRPRQKAKENYRKYDAYNYDCDW